ncbi:glycine C-acetyltransferase [Bythopirellula goksoeyrii]|uniref:2-amino-3-ketobutyrate coenzyme A ligase n=1 Tax=Bythopirellula goksoeyrii TaxID=1400387 RepID=A0A5B9Q8P9_9BACT|nr:glycine C-acetyltransferase [Bythopirellula goksoeyrii]QEG33925.1 2-amino-3-ketobutyrate coenzyme A ligase [Bythopirellula goksoeyrii]
MSTFIERIELQLAETRKAGLYKEERHLRSAQNARVQVTAGEKLNLCANNYLGLANHPEVVKAAHEALDRWGYGLASVRFICGTQSCHEELEKSLSQFLGTQDTILYSSCFDANAGLFETLLTDEDAIISDELNHASIIDGVRLCKARRFRYLTGNMQDLREQLQAADAIGARTKLITTDGVFSMDGSIAKLDHICELADEFNALVHFDDCHAVGFWGPNGRGTHEHCGVVDRIDITTGTLGKALGGASGGYTSGKREIIEFLRQRSRPYLFSNSVAPPVVGGAIKALEIAGCSNQLREKLRNNTNLFRSEMAKRGFDILSGQHPIIPIMLGDAKLATQMATELLNLGVYVIGFSYPVVPKGKARIRIQVSAAHSENDLQFAVEQFVRARAKVQS